MRTLLGLGLALLCTYANAQKMLRPAEWVTLKQASGIPFTSIQVFEKAPDQRIEKGAVDAVWFFCNTNVIIPLQRERPEALSLPLSLADGSAIELEMVQVQPFSADFSVLYAAPQQATNAENLGLFYQGRIKGVDHSLVAISIYSDRVTGVISSPQHGNLVIGPVDPAHPTLHLLHADDRQKDRPDFHCYSPDGGLEYRPEDLRPSAQTRQTTNPCVRLYLEVDYDVFVDKRGQDGTLQYITGLFNQVAALYANEGINLTLAQVFIWNTTSPYSGSDTYTLLTQFQRTRSTFNGDAAELITYKGGGGIAVVDGLCRPYNSFKMGVAGIGRSYANLPVFSFSVMVVAHELGHILGSQHTHACVWNGNNTAIDACPGYTEGACAAAVGTPSGGGTIMSYCHLNTVGINFSKGFGPQPGQLIRNRIAQASCLQACSGNPGGGGTGSGSGNDNAATCSNVTFQLNLDLFGSETSWEILNPAGVAVEKGGPYVDKTLGQKIERKVCLPYACYTLKIYDRLGDGICCTYGEGSYRLLNAQGVEISKGGAFGKTLEFRFCVEAADGGGNPPASTCILLDFNRYPVLSFGGSQDGGTASIAEAGKALTIKNNAWKAVALNYTVTPKTVLEFEFKSTDLGEIHGIGFDDDENISSPYTFQLWGTQTWGLAEYRNYTGDGQWKKYTIPVGKFYTGTFNRLFFAADKDAAPSNGESQYRQVRIYEETPCPGLVDPEPEWRLEQSPTKRPAVQVVPNPASSQVSLRLNDWPPGPAQATLVDALGRVVLQQTLTPAPGSPLQDWTVDCSSWSSGIYFYFIQRGSVQQSGRLVIRH